jgi:hypothetical protein
MPALRHGEGSFRLHTEFAHGLTVPLEVDLRVVRHGQATLFRGDLQLVAARRFAGAGDEGG